MVEDSKSARGSFEVGQAEDGISLVRFSGDWVLKAGMTSAENILADLDPTEAHL
jgi:hypothetical protein